RGIRSSDHRSRFRRAGHSRRGDASVLPGRDLRGTPGALMIRYGAWTLFRTEVRRFFRVPGPTLLTPVITTALYLVAFGSALGGRLREMNGVPYLSFITPGLVMLAVITNAFANSSTSMFISKLQGTVVDLLVAPLRYSEIVMAMVGGATVRALLVGLLTFVAALFFHERVQVAHPFLALVVP